MGEQGHFWLKFLVPKFINVHGHKLTFFQEGLKLRW